MKELRPVCKFEVEEVFICRTKLRYESIQYARRQSGGLASM
jgi:hypothetical protein